MSNPSEIEAVDVSIIVVAWNVKKLLQDCLRSVYEHTHEATFEVVYVDNGSQDGSVEMVRREYPQVHLIENAQNEGFIKANNQGIEVARGRYVLLLNSDTILLDDVVAGLVRFADAHPEAAVVGPRVLNPDGTLQRNCFMFPSVLNMFLFATYLNKMFPRSRFFGRERMTWWDFDEARQVETVCGCCSLVRKAAIDQVGMMDPRYFVYGDDPDWCYRFRQAGWTVWFAPVGRIIHLGGQNTRQMARKFRWQLAGSTLLFVKLHRGPAAFWAARLLHALFFWLRLPYWIGAGLIGRPRAWQQVGTYAAGGWFCLAAWKRLLMKRDVVEEKISEPVVAR
ncbi:MAG TPA: glycosyltransferase family 2 protein [Chromatiales bacterium]|nr:glycosyltransferase family 2 protein [Chromatiales bacterium]